MRRLSIAVITVALVVQAGPANAYWDAGWDPQDSGGSFLDFRSSARKTWSGADGRRWLRIKFKGYGDYQFIWRVRIWLDSRGGPGADYIMTLSEFDQSPVDRCTLHPRPGRPGERVLGYSPFPFVVDPEIFGVWCRVPLGSVHATKRIRWRLVSIDLQSGTPHIIDRAPDGVSFYR
jgi:hypothetical protein